MKSNFSSKNNHISSHFIKHCSNSTHSFFEVHNPHSVFSPLLFVKLPFFETFPTDSIKHKIPSCKNVLVTLHLQSIFYWYFLGRNGTNYGTPQKFEINYFSVLFWCCKISYSAQIFVSNGNQYDYVSEKAFLTL